MKIVEYIKTIFLEFSFIKDYISKKTNERLVQKKISNMSFDMKRYNQTPSKTTRKLFEKYTNTD
jgi:hypothetical protein